MKEETTNEKSTCIARHTICHPMPSGRGSAVRFTLCPAHGNVPGCVRCEIARQKTCSSVQGGVPTFAMFDWENKIAMKFCVSDLAQFLMVFRGMQEWIQDGKGLFHRTATSNVIIKFSRRIEPRPGYLLEVSSKPIDGELSSAFFVFHPDEALWFSTALEGAMPALVFGVPVAVEV